MAVLYLPKSATPPYQVVIYFPGSNAIQDRTTGAIENWTPQFDFILKNGRAVLFPMYKGTFERSDDLNSDYPAETAFYRDHVIMWAKDLGRSIDYLETRNDIALDRTAYYGFSWGAALGAMWPAIEERIRLVISYVGGLYQTRAFPKADQTNFLPRVKVPVPRVELIKEVLNWLDKYLGPVK